MTVGIYCIEHLDSGKRYVGKSRDIERRFRTHKRFLESEILKHRNRYLQAAVHKYSIDGFSFYILEELPLDEDILSNRELFWMDLFHSYEPSFGYNLRRDSDSRMIVHESTRELKRQQMLGDKNHMFGATHSDAVRKQLSDMRTGTKHTKETRAKMSDDRSGSGNAMYEKRHSEDTKMLIAQKISKYYFEQYSIHGELLRVWKSKQELELAGFHSGHIYSVCNGTEKLHKGFAWKKYLTNSKS